jgi:predicted lipoprotein with Yx(FWY)xxD motif
MGRIGNLRAAVLVAIAVAAALAVGVLLATRSGNASSGTTSRTVVEVAKNPTLGKRVLATRSGLTLYSLSAERHGRFICTASCTSLWKPLLVSAGVKPGGAGDLTAVERPDGKRQVAYRGAPLYRFVQDMRPGDAKGDGFRDVGVWRPAVVGAKAAPAPAPAPAPSNNSYGY